MPFAAAISSLRALPPLSPRSPAQTNLTSKRKRRNKSRTPRKAFRATLFPVCHAQLFQRPSAPSRDTGRDLCELTFGNRFPTLCCHVIATARPQQRLCRATGRPSADRERHEDHGGGQAAVEVEDADRVEILEDHVSLGQWIRAKALLDDNPRPET